MKYAVGGKVTTKKPHACGANVWTVIRIGADVKIKCDKCERSVFVSVDQLDRMAKKYQPSNENDSGELNEQ